MADTIVLDPSAVATGRTELDITSWVRVQGVDYGDAAYEAYMADAEQGSLPVDGRLPNRIVTIPLVLRPVGATSFSTIRLQLQQKVGLFQREGGWVMRQVGAAPLYAEVVNATLRLGGDWLQANRDADIEAVLTLECLPPWLGEEIDLGLATETTNPEIVFTDTNIKGNYPGPVRLVVNEDQGVSQRGLIGGFRSRHYDSAATAALAYAGTALGLMDTAGTASGQVVHSNLATTWTPVLNTNMGGTAALTHTGSYRVWAGVGGTADGTDVSCRFVWDVGDMTNPVVNELVTVPGFGSSYLLDLGAIRLDPAPVGTHSWQGIVQAKGAAGGEDIQVKRLWFQPLDECAWQLRAPLASTDGLSTYIARDDFTGIATADVTGRVLPTGGTWTGAGDADDFSGHGSEYVIFRAKSNDANGSGSPHTGRFLTASAVNAAGVAVQADIDIIEQDVATGDKASGLVARYVDINNWLIAGIWGQTSGVAILRVQKRVASTTTLLAEVELPAFIYSGPLGERYWYTFRLAADATGAWGVWLVPQGAFVSTPILAGADTALATGGALDDGDAGVFDYNVTADTGDVTRFDNFAVWTAPTDAVIFASQSLEMRTEGFWREDATAAAYGPVAHVTGSLPRIPVSGLEGRTVQTFIKATRGDLDLLPDTGTDDISVQASYRPAYLYIPDP